MQRTGQVLPLVRRAPGGRRVQVEPAYLVLSFLCLSGAAILLYFAFT